MKTGQLAIQWQPAQTTAEHVSDICLPDTYGKREDNCSVEEMH